MVESIRSLVNAILTLDITCTFSYVWQRDNVMEAGEIWIWAIQIDNLRGLLGWISPECECTDSRVVQSDKGSGLKNLWRYALVVWSYVDDGE